MTKTRGVRILVWALLGVALAAPVAAACACLVPASEPMLAASCHTPPAAALTAGCCCIESPAGEVDGEPAAMPAPRVATTVATSVAAPVGTALAVPHPMPVPIRAAPPRHAVPLRL